MKSSTGKKRRAVFTRFLRFTDETETTDTLQGVYTADRLGRYLVSRRPSWFVAPIQAA
jgi:hypothetical protein